MKFRHVRLHSWAYEEPSNFITSDEIEKQLASTYERLKLPEGRLELQTGIKRRGYWPRGTRPSSIASLAAKKLLTQFDKNKIGMLSMGSVCRDFLEPATAAVVHHELGLSKNCTIFDLSNACLGVMSSTMVAAQMIELGHIQAALIVSGENSGPLLLKTIETLQNDQSLTRQSIKKYIASLTIGSAGVAWLLTHESLAPHAPKILGGVTRTDSSAVELCQGSGTLEDLVMETDSEALLKAGISLATETWQSFLDEMNLSASQITKVIPHQVGSTHRRAFMDGLGIAGLPDFATFDQYGNTGSAALPLTFMKAQQAGFFESGDLVAFTGIGSGLTSTMLCLEYL